MTIPLTPAGGCNCGHDHELPVLDARTIPHAVRHGAILGALGQLPSGGSMALVAPHDPKPLLAQISQLHGDLVAIEYLERGPEKWTLKLTRA